MALTRDSLGPGGPLRLLSPWSLPSSWGTQRGILLLPHPEAFASGPQVLPQLEPPASWLVSPPDAELTTGDTGVEEGPWGVSLPLPSPLAEALVVS